MDEDDFYLKGRTAYEAGEYDEAIEFYTSAVAAGHRLTECHFGIGLSLLGKNEYQSAVDHWDSQGLTLPEVWSNKAICFEALGNLEKHLDALAHVVAHRRETFLPSFQQAALLGKKHGRWDLAHAALSYLHERSPDDQSLGVQLLEACRHTKHLKQGIEVGLKMIDMGTVDATKAGVHGTVGGLYKDCAEQERALHHFRRCYELNRVTQAASNHIMMTQYAYGVSFTEFYNLCREYSARFLRDLPRYQHPMERLDPNKESLRIGFIGGDFVAHSLAHLIVEPICAIRDHSTFEVYIYSSREEEKEDHISERYQDYVDKWRRIHPLSQEDAAKLVYEDQIDILVDLAGHTALNRLPVLGYKPAPVQAGWVSGMMTPPAIETVNYFFTDEHMVSPKTADLCSEMLLELPSAYTYFPIGEVVPEVAPLPRDRKRHISFGSINNPCKMSIEVIDTWAKILQRVNGSHLHMKVYDKTSQDRFTLEFGRRGIPPARLVFIDKLPRNQDVLRYYTEEIDICLDTWPCTGCLTSAEALWMGAPVVTHYGDAFLSRQTLTILNQIGLSDLAADTLNGYAEAAIELATDVDRLRELRVGMRDRMNAAPIRDCDGVAKAMIAGFRTMWTHWCSTRQPLLSLFACPPG